MDAAADGYDLTRRPKLWRSNPPSSKLRVIQLERDRPPVNICDSGSASQGMSLSPLPFPDLEISDGARRVWEMGGQESAKQLCH